MKLKALKKALKSGSWETFGNILNEEKVAEEEIRVLEKSLEEDISEESQIKLNEAKAKHIILINRVTEFWRQKSQYKGQL